MNISAPIRGWSRGCWVWSAHPIAALLALALLIAQSWWLMRFEYDPGNTSGSRQALKILKKAETFVKEDIGKYFIRSYPALPDSAYQRDIGFAKERFYFAWERDREEYLAAPHYRLRDREFPLGSVTIQYTRACARTGVWAPTRLRCHIRYSLNNLNGFERDIAFDLMANAYREHGTKHREVIATAIRNRQPMVTKTLHSGYAHNAAAVLFLGVMLRGIMGLLQRIRKRLRVTRHRCVACDANLRQQTRGRCPECGVLIPDVHTEIYTEREKIPGIESSVFGVAGGTAAGGGGHQADKDADRAGGDEPEPGR